MSTACKMLLTAGLAVCLVSITLAQPNPGGRGGFTPGGPMILMAKDVQSELKLTADQKEKIAKIREKYEASVKKAFEDKNAKSFEAVKTAREDSQKDLENVIKDLKPEQAKRYHQINNQLSGLTALTNEANQKELKLTDAQKTKIKGLADDYAKDAQELRKSGGKDKDKQAEIRTKIDKMRAETLTKAADTLTAEQKKTWQEMTGAKFEGKLDDLPGFGGGRFGKDKKDK